MMSVGLVVQPEQSGNVAFGHAHLRVGEERLLEAVQIALQHVGVADVVAPALDLLYAIVVELTFFSASRTFAITIVEHYFERQRGRSGVLGGALYAKLERRGAESVSVC